MDDKIKLAKGITKFVVGISVGSVVGKVIKTNVSPTNTLESAQLMVGAYTLGGMVSDQAIDWIGPKFDDAASKLKSALTENATE